MDQAINAPLYSGALFAGMLVLVELGRRVGERRAARNPDAGEIRLASVEGSLFALFGLLLAFTFSGAGERYDSRRRLIAEEANAIGTAYLRLDLLAQPAQPALRSAFRDYLSSRLEVYRNVKDWETINAGLARSEAIQRSIWSASIAATRLEGGHPDAGKLLLPALNEMIDITTTRTMAAKIHPAPVVYYLLFALGLGCAFYAGLGMAARHARSWLHIFGFLLTTALVVFVILDLEYPRLGFFTIANYDQVLVDLLASMK